LISLAFKKVHAEPLEEAESLCASGAAKRLMKAASLARVMRRRVNRFLEGPEEVSK